jgi:hypothetical protein
LAGDPDENVRVGVAEHSSIGLAIIAKLLKDTSPQVRREAIGHPQALHALDFLCGTSVDVPTRAVPTSRPAKASSSALLDEAKEALDRTLASQLGLMVRDSLVGLLGRSDGQLAASVAVLMKTSLGKSLTMGSLSLGLTLAEAKMPASWHPNVARLGHELSVGALSLAGDELADLVTWPLREVMSTLLGSNPEEMVALLPLKGATFDAARSLDLEEEPA